MAAKTYQVRIRRRHIAYEEEALVTVTGRSVARACNQARQHAGIEWQRVPDQKPRFTRPMVVACDEVEASQ